MELDRNVVLGDAAAVPHAQRGSIRWLKRLVFLACCVVSQRGIADQRPNVLLIVADDLGYADVGCFGSEIDTPNIDQLASEGLLFSQFRATPMCVMSRIALMSGMPLHAVGRHDYAQSIPLAPLLKTAGYRTMMTGKWHAGTPTPQSRELFDRSFGFLGGMTDSFVGGNDWFSDDNSFKDFSEGFYSTAAFTNRSIEFMREAVSKQQPFFMCVAYNAPHHPCQAPQETVDRYLRTYRRGYDALRKERRAKQITLGLVDPACPDAAIGNEVRRWNEFTVHRQEVEARRIDDAVGTPLSTIDRLKLADKTINIFASEMRLIGDDGNILHQWGLRGAAMTA